MGNAARLTTGLLGLALLAGRAAAQDAGDAGHLVAWTDSDHRTIHCEGRIEAGLATGEVYVSFHYRTQMFRILKTPADPTTGRFQADLGPLPQALAEGEWEVRAIVATSEGRREFARYDMHVGRPMDIEEARRLERERLGRRIDFLVESFDSMRGRFGAAPPPGEPEATRQAHLADFRQRVEATLPRIQQIFDSSLEERRGARTPLFPDVMQYIEQMGMKLTDLLTRMDASLHGEEESQAVPIEKLIEELSTNLPRAREMLEESGERSYRTLFVLARRASDLAGHLEREAGRWQGETFESRSWMGFSWQFANAVEMFELQAGGYDGSPPALDHPDLVARSKALAADLRLAHTAVARRLADRHHAELRLEHVTDDLWRAARAPAPADVLARIRKEMDWLSDVSRTEWRARREEIREDYRTLERLAREVLAAHGLYRSHAASHHGKAYPDDVREAFAKRFHGGLQHDLLDLRDRRYFRDLTMDVYFPDASRDLCSAAGFLEILGSLLVDEFEGKPERILGGHGAMHEIDRAAEIDRMVEFAGTHFVTLRRALDVEEQD